MRDFLQASVKGAGHETLSLPSLKREDTVC